MEKFYGPEEDTHMLIEALEPYLKKNPPKKSLEIGVGNGQVSKAISKYSENHTGVDINPNAIEEAKRVCEKGNFFISNLFENIEGQYDLIAFNPPYLPSRADDPDDWITKAIVGGKKGYEIILKFLDELPNYLADQGACFLLFSKLSEPEFILQKLDKLLLSKELVLEKTIMMEELYVYKIKKSEIILDLKERNYQNIKFFAKGCHGFILTAEKDNKKAGIKILNPNSQAFSAIENESNNLLFVNTLGIGPKVIETKRNFLSYEFIEGIPWSKYYPDKSLNEIKEIIYDLLDQCYKMDKAGFEKREMKRPIKNLIIRNDDKPFLIDFERGRMTKRPGNMTQFLQYFSNSKFAHYLTDTFQKTIDPQIIRELSIEYMKSNYSKEMFEKIKDYLTKELF